MVPHCSIVAGMRWIGLTLYDGYSDRPVNGLVFLPQKNRVRQASCCFAISRVKST